MIPHGVPIFVATETIDMRLGFERLGGLVREWMAQEPRQRALFVFIGKRRVSMKILSWDGRGVLMLYKRLDDGTFDVPTATHKDDRHIVMSEALLGVLWHGERGVVKRSARRVH
jgi:transposase